MIGVPLLLATATILFWSLRQATHFLGDGDLWIKTIETGQLCRSWDLVFSCSLYTTISRILGLFGGLDARTASGMISVASGLVFLYFAWNTARQLSDRRDEQILLLLAVLSTGSMMLFFGYVEAYPPAAAGLMIYLYYAARSLKGRSGPNAAAVACMAAIILHPSMVALLPSLFVLYIFRRERKPDIGRYLLTVSITILAGLAVLWALQRWRLFGGYFNENFLPILPGGARNRIPYAIVSWGSLVDLLNEIFLVCPMMLFSAAVLLLGERGAGKGGDRTCMFFATASLYFVLMFVVGNKLLGASRDWDVFAPMAFPIALFTATLLLNRYRRYTREMALFAGFVLALHTVPWIVINASTESSLRRFSDLALNSRWSSFARGYACDELGTYYFDHDEMPHALEYSLAAVEADPGNVRYLYNAAARHMVAGRNDDAVRMFENVIQRRPDYLDARLNLGTIYMNMDRFGDAKEEFLEVARADTSSAMAYRQLAHIYWKEGHPEKAGALYARAIEIDPDNPQNYLNLALLRLNAGGTAEARKLMEKSIDVDPGYAPAYYHLGTAYAKEGDVEKALELYGKHVSLDPTALDVRFEMAVALDRLGRLGEALGHLLHIYEKRPGDVRVMNNIGVIYSKRAEFDQAVSIFEKALRVDPNQPDVLLNAARAYCRLGDYSKAWLCVMRAERLGADVPDKLLSDLNRNMPRPGAP